MKISLSNAEARRMALAAQGFDCPRPRGRVDRRHLGKVLDRMGLIQIDSVNVFVRSQELPLFARIGPHVRTMIDAAMYKGELFEYWVHEASIVPTNQYYLHRWKMNEQMPWLNFRTRVAKLGNYVEEVYRRIVEEGPIVAADLKTRTEKKGPWWDYDDGKAALEALFFQGRISARRRQKDFARIYDLTERLIPREHLERPALCKDEAHKELLVLAARSLGVATFDDLADYYRVRPAACRHLIAELLDEERLISATVEGWDRPALVHPKSRLPRRINARALLSPFDPVVWYRDRTHRLFDFFYRIEIYTPEPKRKFGYYVLPFLLGDELVGRLDLKADRQNENLLVQSAWIEAGKNEKNVAREMAAELKEISAWLDLKKIIVADRGNIAHPLRKAIGQNPQDDKV